MYYTVKCYTLEYWYKFRVLISGSGLDENNGFLQKDIEKVQKMRGDLTTLNKLSSSTEKSELLQAQSLRKQYFPIASDEINTTSTENNWAHLAFWFFAGALVVLPFGLYYLGYLDRFFPGTGGTGDTGSEYDPLYGTPQSKGDIELPGADSSSINKLSEIGESSSSSSTSGSLTPKWDSNNKTLTEYNHYFAKTEIDSVAQAAKTAANNEAELKTFASHSDWSKKAEAVIAPTPNIDPAPTPNIDPASTSAQGLTPTTSNNNPVTDTSSLVLAEVSVTAPDFCFRLL